MAGEVSTFAGPRRPNVEDVPPRSNQWIPHVHHLPRNDPLWRLYWRLFRYLLPICGRDGRVLESLDRTITASGPGAG